MKIGRLIRALAVAGLVIVVAAPVAGAHVTIDPGEATKGGFATLAFRVPNERDNAGTTALEVNFPEDHPLPSVSIQPKPGWTYQVERRQLDEPSEGEGTEITEVVSKITWTGGRIRPGEFDAFEVSVGPLPEDTDQLLFPTIQTYDSGEILRWIDEPVEGEPEPEHPTPALALVDPEGEGSSSASAEATSDSEQGVVDTSRAHRT